MEVELALEKKQPDDDEDDLQILTKFLIFAMCSASYTTRFGMKRFDGRSTCKMVRIITGAGNLNML